MSGDAVEVLNLHRGHCRMKFVPVIVTVEPTMPLVGVKE